MYIAQMILGVICGGCLGASAGNFLFEDNINLGWGLLVISLCSAICYLVLWIINISKGG